MQYIHKKFSGYSREDYRQIILGFKEALIAKQMTIKQISEAHGFYTPTAQKVYTELKKEGMIGFRAKHKIRKPISREIEDAIRLHKFKNLSEVARHYGVSREYTSQIKKRLVLSKLIKARKQPWD